jgi:hypothetical protein
MEDFTLATLHESRNEWCSQLINILTPLIIEGYNSIFEESWTLCEENEETEKYLMTFQNFISRVPKWNATIIEKEKSRILERSRCSYIEDLLTCVHVIQLKSLTCIRAGKDQKKININIPKFDNFIHKVYIQVARKLYTNIYLYDKNVLPLQRQKHNREFEQIVQECILNVVRDNMPIEEILRCYLDETNEEDVEETIIDEKIPIEEDKHTKVAVNDNIEGTHENIVKTNENLPSNVKFDIQTEDLTNNVKQNLDKISKIREETSGFNSNDNVDDERFEIKETLDPSLLNIEIFEPQELKEKPPKIDIEIL